MEQPAGQAGEAAAELAAAWLRVPAPGRWTDDARCVGLDPVSFTDPDGETFEVARRVCRKCPVRVDCGAYGASVGAVGVWGGELLREQRRRPHVPAA